MNRGDYILQQLNAVVDDETTFTVVSRLKENSQNVGTTTSVYLYILKESVVERYEDDRGQVYSVDVGVRLSKTISQTASGASWRNDVIHKLEKSLRTFTTSKTTEDTISITIGSAYVAEIGGYFDDNRTNADAEAIINLTCIQR